jgi:hypothetical protein
MFRFVTDNKVDPQYKFSIASNWRRNNAARTIHSSKTQRDKHVVEEIYGQHKSQREFIHNQIGLEWLSNRQLQVSQ